MAKALTINAFALSGRVKNPIATQGDALGYALMPFQGACPRM